MASTVLPPIAGLVLPFPSIACKPRLHPRHLLLLHTTESSHASTRVFCEAECKLPSLLYRQSIQPVFSSSGGPSRAASPPWRCRTGDQSSGLQPVSTDSEKPKQDPDTSQADFLARIDHQDDELLPVAAARLVKAEQERQKYLGRALRAGKGAVIAELLQIFGNLLERPFGGGESVANAGGAVIERVVDDVQKLRGEDGVNDQMLFELLKVIRFLEMDMELVRAARQEETLLKRLETAQMHCKQAFAIANSF